MTNDQKNALKKGWKAAQKKAYILTAENVQALFEYLEEQLEHTGCDHTLRHTVQWFPDHISPEMMEAVVAEINDMGGYCDCEVLLNCYEDYVIG